MILNDDETCIVEGRCDDILPQYFEIVDGQVRVREAQEPRILPLSGDYDPQRGRFHQARA